MMEHDEATEELKAQFESSPGAKLLIVDSNDNSIKYEMDDCRYMGEGTVVVAINRV